MKNQFLQKIKEFFTPEEINGKGRCPTSMYRWFLLKTPWGKVYLHHFVGDNWTSDFHDHPKRFISIGLWGSYVEQTPRGSRIYRAPWIRTFPAHHIHNIVMGRSKSCWTLVTVLKTIREWGFFHEEKWIHWKIYVPSIMADKAKICPD